MAPKYRMAAVKEAPVFHPTPEEFEDPIRYVASIRAEAEPYGLCRIVPPAGWEVPFHQDPATFSFKTRIQTVNELQLRLKKGKHRGFRAEYADFMQTQGQSVTRSPVFAGRKLDLQSLYDCVASGGGFDAACSGKRWRDIARTIVSADVGPSEAFALRQLYQKWLLAYEKHKKHQESLSPTGKAKEAAATKREREEERKREKAEAKAAAERAAAMDEETSEKEEDVLEALFELGNAADPPPKRLKLELVRAIPSARSPTFFFFSRGPTPSSVSRASPAAASARAAERPAHRRDRGARETRDSSSRSRPARATPRARAFSTPRPRPRRTPSPIDSPSTPPSALVFLFSLPNHRAGSRGGGHAGGGGGDDRGMPELRRNRARGVHDPLRRMRPRVRHPSAPRPTPDRRTAFPPRLPRHHAGDFGERRSGAAADARSQP
jgi:hypothetical protein